MNLPRKLHWFRIPFDLSLSEEELVGAGLKAHDTPSLFFLGKFSERQLCQLLQKAGLLNGFRHLGYSDFMLWADTRDPYLQRIALYDQKIDTQNLLFEVIAKQENATVVLPRENPGPLLSIEWLSLQNPRATATVTRKLLPGQLFPGTGLSQKALQFIILIGEALKASGIGIVPEYFHNAYLYNRVANFLQAETEGRFLALCRDLLKDHDLAMVSWAIENGRVQENSKIFRWFSERQIMPVSMQFKSVFKDKEWQLAVKEAKGAFRYTILKT